MIVLPIVRYSDWKNYHDGKQVRRPGQITDDS